MTSEEFRSRLSARTDVAGVSLSLALVDRLESYFQLLSIWNRRINLTALDLDRLPDEAVDRLLVEPLAAARYAPSHEPVLDIGSGGGSPAIPFALATEASELTMVESRTRKSVFLREASHVVGLSGARVLTARFEDVSKSSEFASHFSVATVRAVRLEDKDWPGLLNVLKPGGLFMLLHQRGSEGSSVSSRTTHPLTGDAAVSIWTKAL